MAIDAVILRVRKDDDGNATLVLGARRTRDGLVGPGQREVTVVDPPRFLEAAVGTELREDRDTIFVGETVWAKRLTKHRIQLVGRGRTA